MKRSRKGKEEEAKKRGEGEEEESKAGGIKEAVEKGERRG
jgi:hypothetical protein